MGDGEQRGVSGGNLLDGGWEDLSEDGARAKDLPGTLARLGPPKALSFLRGL